MEQSQSSRFSWLRVWFKGTFRSAHSLLIAALVVCLGFFWLARQSYPIVAYGAFFLFAACMAVIFILYFKRGPEAEHGLPTYTWTPSRVEVVNVVDPKLIEPLARLAAEFRQPLPLPAGIIEGSATNPRDIKPLSPDDAKEIAIQDVASDKATEAKAT